MLKFGFILVLVVILFKCVENKVIIRFDTLFRKGFKKNYDRYGVFCWVRKATEMERHIRAAIIFQRLEVTKKL